MGHRNPGRYLRNLKNVEEKKVAKVFYASTDDLRLEYGHHMAHIEKRARPTNAIQRPLEKRRLTTAE